MEWSFLQETGALHGDALQTRGNWGGGKSLPVAKERKGICVLKVPTSWESKIENLSSKPPLLDVESE